MFTVISKFAVEDKDNSIEEVRQAFRQRPRKVDNTAGFIRLDVLNHEDKPEEFWLITYWENEESFNRWYRSHMYSESHSGIPDGLKLIKDSTELIYFRHISS